MEDMREVDVMEEVETAPVEVVEEKKGFLNSIPKVAKGALAVIGGIFVAGAVYGIKVYIAARKGYTDIPKPGDATDPPVTEADFAE